jgi:hypothetical protein
MIPLFSLFILYNIKKSIFYLFWCCFLAIRSPSFSQCKCRRLLYATLPAHLFLLSSFFFLLSSFFFLLSSFFFLLSSFFFLLSSSSIYNFYTFLIWNLTPEIPSTPQPGEGGVTPHNFHSFILLWCFLDVVVLVG